MNVIFIEWTAEQWQRYSSYDGFMSVVGPVALLLLVLLMVFLIPRIVGLAYVNNKRENPYQHDEYPEYQEDARHR